MTTDRTGRMCLAMVLLSCTVLTGCISSPAAVHLKGKTVLLGPIGTPAAATQPVASGTTRPAGPGTTQPAGSATTYDDSAWQRLLLKNVAAGWTTAPDPQTQELRSPPWPELVDYRQIFEHPEDLNAYLAVLATTGPASTPQLFPTPAEQLAYYINAYNACAIRAALAEYPCETAYTPNKPSFEIEWHFRVDGQRVNLTGLRQKAWQCTGGDVRFLFALCEAAVGSPPLAPCPYEAGDLFDELDAQVKLCISMPQFVTIAHEQEQLRLWWRMIQHREAFGAWYEKLYGTRPESLLNVVMEMTRPQQRDSLNKAVGYKIVEAPFDRGLNDLVVRASTATPKQDE